MRYPIMTTADASAYLAAEAGSARRRIAWRKHEGTGRIGGGVRRESDGDPASLKSKFRSDGIKGRKARISSRRMRPGQSTSGSLCRRKSSPTPIFGCGSPSSTSGTSSSGARESGGRRRSPNSAWVHAQRI